MRKRISVRALISLVLLAASPSALLATEYSHRIWRTEEGLPRNRIQAIEQTPDGYLWVATSGGLARFDGVRFVVFDSSNTPAFRDESITSLWPARDGSLWAGTEGGGLLHYKNGAFVSFGTAEGLTNGFVRSVVEDNAGTIWVGTDRGFFRMSGNRFERLDHGTPDSPFASVVQIAFDKNGRIWVGTQMGLLTVSGGRLVPATCTGESVSGANVSGAIRGLYRTNDGRVFSIDARGFSEVEDGCRRRNGLARDAAVSALREGRDGVLWVGTQGEGVIRYEGNKPQRFTAPGSLPDNIVAAIFEDREQNLWVGSQDGLVLLARTALTAIGVDGGLIDEDITTIYAGRGDDGGRDELRVATWSGRTYRIVDGKPVAMRLPGIDLRVFKPHTMLEDSRGDLWLGSQDAGAARVGHGSPARFSMKEGMRSNDVRQIYEDEDGNIWFATGSGVSRWDGTKLRNFYLDDGLSYPSTRCIAGNPGGGMLIGTDGGLSLEKHGAFVEVPAFAALKQDKIWAILPDPDGTLWLGTRGGGLIRVRNGRITRYTNRDGLVSNAIFQILDDGKGKLWLSSPAGVSSVLRQELDTADGIPGQLHAVPYGTTDGMLTSQMFGGVQPAGARSASGELWFPSLKGAVRIDPSALPDRESMPVVIEQVIAGDRPAPLSGNVVIPPGSGKLEIDYTACNLAAPQRLSFRYKLEGFDDHWVAAMRSRAAYYTNLPPRKYRFVVIATDAASPLRTTQTAISLDLRPSFHQTAWFYALCGLLAALAIFAGTQIYGRQTRSRYALLLAERTRLAREMHDTVIQGCVGVSTLLEAAGRLQESNPDEANALLFQAKQEVRSTLEEARQAVWDLRSPAARDFGVASLMDLARRLGAEKSIAVETEVSGDQQIHDPELDRTLLLVGREALRNAVAHGHPSHIGLRVVFRALDVELEVKDDGVGFLPNSPAAEGNGHFGILGMKERVEHLGGSLTLNGSPGTGTVVVARIPVGQRGKAAVHGRNGAS